MRVCALAILCLSCQNVQLLVHQVRPLSPSEDTYAFDQGRMMLHSFDTGEMLGEIVILRRESLFNLAMRLDPDNPPKRLPELTPVRVSLFNYGTRTLQVDFFNFRIRETGGGALYPAIGPRKYERDYATPSLPRFDPFEQQDAFSFHHARPFWAAELAAKRSPSPLEKERKAESDLSAFKRAHQEPNSPPDAIPSNTSPRTPSPPFPSK